MEYSPYGERILEDYRAPRHRGLMDDFTHEAKAANALCGDTIVVRLALREGVIEEVSFKNMGCVISTVSASRFLDHIKGKNVEEVRFFGRDSVVSLLGVSLMPAREKCATLILEAVKKAL